MEIKPEDELSNIVLFPVKEDDPRNQVNFLYEPSERPYCHLQGQMEWLLLSVL